MTRDATTQAEPMESSTTQSGLTRRATVPLFALAAGAGGFLLTACGSSSDDASSTSSSDASTTTDSDGGADETPSAAATSGSAGAGEELTTLDKVPAGASRQGAGRRSRPTT